jgi:hypothetical protein
MAQSGVLASPRMENSMRPEARTEPSKCGRTAMVRSGSGARTKCKMCYWQAQDLKTYRSSALDVMARLIT